MIEGFHGVQYDAPIGRTREIVEICRQVWRREKVEYQGKYYQIPLPADQGTGLGKPLKLINHPVRERIPIVIAALGPKNVELTAEIAEGWQPIFFFPEKADARVGRRRSPRARPSAIRRSASCRSIAEPGAGHRRRRRAACSHCVKPQLALYIGGMGAKGKNFYNDLAVRYGYEEEAEKIQDLYLAGKKDEAAAAVPDELVRAVISDRHRELRQGTGGGVRRSRRHDTQRPPFADDTAGRVAQVEQLQGSDRLMRQTAPDDRRPRCGRPARRAGLGARPASTITRTSCSVPRAAAEHAAVLAELVLAISDGVHDGAVRSRRRLCPTTGTLTAPGATSRMTDASSVRVRPVSAIRSITRRPVSTPSPVVPKAGSTTCPDCSPPSAYPPAAQLLQDVAITDCGGTQRDSCLAHRDVQAEIAHDGGDQRVVGQIAGLLHRERRESP